MDSDAWVDVAELIHSQSDDVEVGRMSCVVQTSFRSQIPRSFERDDL